MIGKPLGKNDSLYQTGHYSVVRYSNQAFYDTVRDIYLVGIDFSEEERNLSGFTWEKYLRGNDE